jgi:Ner family transcriptional regulator
MPESPSDWHPADIVSALRKSGLSLARLAVVHGYSSGAALSNALRSPYPKAERIIAEAIKRTPQEIWPSRYHADGRPRSGFGERSYGFPGQYPTGDHGRQQPPDFGKKIRAAA